MNITVNGRNLTIEDELAECAKEHYIDLQPEDCEIIINSRLTPDLQHLGKIDFKKEYSLRTDEELSNLLTEGVINELKTIKGYTYAR